MAALVAVGHEELSRLQFGSPRGELSFAKTLSNSWRTVASSLYGALRDGMAHGYGAQTIIYEGGRVVLGISVGQSNPPRLAVRPWAGEGDDVTHAVVLSARRLVADLGRQFDRFEEELRRDGHLRDAFGERGMKGREHSSHRAPPGG